MKLCWLGIHIWRYQKPFEQWFTWVTATTQSPAFNEWYQERRCVRCGKRIFDKVDTVSGQQIALAYSEPSLQSTAATQPQAGDSPPKAKGSS